MEGAEVLVFVVPSKGMGAIARQAAAFTDCHDQLILTCTNGFDLASHKLMTEILEETFPRARAIAVLSGPNLAREIAQQQPAATVIACREMKEARFLQKCFLNGYFRPYTSTDVIGVELCGCVKNCIALVGGMLSGLGYGENAQAGLITRGLAEITRLGVKMGARRATFFGLAGVGDLREECIRLAQQLGLSGRVLFPGEVDTAELVGFCDAVVSASHSEGLPFHLMEGMACGLPAAVTDIKGHRDLVEPEVTGLLCPPEDEAALAAAIARLAGDPDTRRAWGRAAQARSGRYARQRVVPQVLGEYRQWLEGREGDG